MTDDRAGGFWVGSYTGDRGAGRGVYRLGTRSDGALEPRGLAAVADSPSYLAVHPRLGMIYAACETSAEIVAFDVGDGGALRPATRVAVPAGPCHLAVHPSGSHLLVASYRAGAFVAVPLAADGAPGGRPTVLAGRGSGPRPGRQDGPHAHAVVVAPDGVVLGTDLGADLVRALRIDPIDGSVRPVAELALPSGCGPRHLVVHPSGFVFVLTELARTVLVLRPRAAYADLEVVDEVPATADPPPDDAACAAIRLGVGGRFVYTSTRGADVVTTHRVEAGGARLRAVADTDCRGRWPRDLWVDGERLHVANERSAAVASFALDPSSGRPRPIGSPAEVPAPACIVAAARPS